MKTMISTAASLSALMLVAACANTPTMAGDPAPAFDTDFPPALVELNFESHGDRLNGHAYLADGPGPHPTVVLLHGFPGNERNLDLAQDLRHDGFNVLFFHYRGAWGSEGTYSFTHVIEDVAAATDYLRANAEALRTNPDKLILVGHSMGGHGALTLHFKYPDTYRSCSAFSPITSPSRVPWGEKAFTAYIGPPSIAWEQYDATELVQNRQTDAHILIDTGKADQFLEPQLKPEIFIEACEMSGQALTYRLHEGYGHDYYFIATFMSDHIAHHAKALKA